MRAVLSIRVRGYYYTRKRDEPLHEWHMRALRQ